MTDDRDGAVARIRAAVAGAAATDLPPVGVSIGTARYTTSFDDAFRTADLAIYEDKRRRSHD